MDLASSQGADGTCLVSIPNTMSGSLVIALDLRIIVLYNHHEPVFITVCLILQINSLSLRDRNCWRALSRSVAKPVVLTVTGRAWLPQSSQPHSASGQCGCGGNVSFAFAFLSPVACTFSCMMKFTVKDCDPNTGETDDEGYEDEYVVRSWACI